MKKHPFFHALLAALYIVGIVYLMQAVTSGIVEESILIPMVVLSLFVLSAAVMGFLFIYEPFRLYMDGQKVPAVHFFFHTILYFALLVAIFIGALFLSGGAF
jgi:hypothetical protein